MDHRGKFWHNFFVFKNLKLQIELKCSQYYQNNTIHNKYIVLLILYYTFILSFSNWSLSETYIYISCYWVNQRPIGIHIKGYYISSFIYQIKIHWLMQLIYCHGEAHWCHAFYLGFWVLMSFWWFILFLFDRNHYK